MSSFNVNRFRRPSEVFRDDFEWFDPWKDTELNTPTSFRWINQPTNKERIAPALQSPTTTTGNKYRVKIDISDFDSETIQTTVEGRLLIVEAKKKSDHTQQRIAYDLPERVYEHAEADHLVSYVTPNNVLIVDIPLHNHEHEQRYRDSTHEDHHHHHHLVPYGQQRDQSFNYSHFHTSPFTPKIVDVKQGHEKKLQMSLPMKNYRPEQIKISVKNNDLIVQGEHISPHSRSFERTYFYNSITLPPGTQIDQLESHLTNDGHLQIEAPFIPKN